MADVKSTITPDDDQRVKDRVAVERKRREKASVSPPQLTRPGVTLPDILSVIGAYEEPQ